jgi:hypothetical protein
MLAFPVSLDFILKLGSPLGPKYSLRSRKEVGRQGDMTFPSFSVNKTSFAYVYMLLKPHLNNFLPEKCII